MTKVISDSIAIKILTENQILTGVGNELHLYSIAKGDTVTSVLPFRLRGKIHGIEVGIGAERGNQNILIFGEKEFALIRFVHDVEFKFTLQCRGFFSDWISGCRILVENDHFVIISAHNVVVQWQNIPNSCDFKIVKRASCTDKSTLYCSHVHGNTWEDLVLFGGNALGELLVWKPSYQKGVSDRVPLLHRIACHNGVIFSIDFDITSQLLTTTSDDRSIRVWKICDTNNPSQLNEDWVNNDFKPLASGYGHVSRVFRGRIVKNGHESFLFTVGEDSNFCIWTTSGKLLFKRRQQFGAVIWDFEYDHRTKTLFTVGSMGNLSAYSLEGIIDKRFNDKPTLLPANLDQLEYLQKVKFVKETLMIGLTNFNRLLLNKKRNSDFTEWYCYDGIPNIKFTVLEVYKNLVALCGYQKVTLIRFDEINQKFETFFEGDVLPGIIRSFKFLSSSEFLVSDGAGNCIIVHENDMNCRKNIELPTCKERWITAAVKLGNLLVLSNRVGNILLYLNDTDGCWKHAFTMKQVHGNLGATSFILEENNIHRGIIKSTGHDGTINRISVCKHSRELHILTSAKVPISWIEKLVLYSGTELVLGFNDNHFALWTKEEDLVLQVACGGGHRCWDFNIDNGRISLVFIKNKQIYFHRHNLQRTTLYNRNHWHVKPCNDLKIIEISSSSEIIIISAGDDNVLLINSYFMNSRKLKYRAEVHSHISNIRALNVIHEEGSKYVIFSAGGRAQICASEFNVSTQEIAEKTSFTISPTNFTKQCMQQISFNPETRVMSIDVKRNKDDFTIFVGCSDGFVRKYNVGQNWKFHFVAQAFFAKCILHVRLVEDCFISIAATDGVVRFCCLSLDEILFEIKHHDNGVNAIDMIYDNIDKIIHLLTGGDDQTVAYSKIHLVEMNNKPENYVTKRLYLHTAQVTAVKFSPCRQFIYTSGVDQNLIRTCLQTWHSEELLHTCVSDMKGMALTKSAALCFLFGCGLQILTI